MKIKNTTQQDIGAQLERLCALSGMAAPKDPKQTAHFIKEKLQGYEFAVLKDAIDWYCEGHMDERPYDVTAMFMLKITRAYLRHGNKTGKVYYRHEGERIVEQQDNELVARKALAIAFEHYYTQFYTDQPDFKLVMRELEGQAEYIKSKGWVRSHEIDADTAGMLKDQLIDYSTRKNVFMHNEKLSINPFRAMAHRMQQKVNHDYDKAIVCAYLFEKQIANGKRPK